MMLYKVQDTTDNLVLLLTALSKAVTIDVYMLAAGACLMRAISQGYSLFHYLLPLIILVIVKAHRVAYKLHAVIERSVAFNVDMLLVPVGDSKYLVGIIAVFSCTVNLQLNSEIPLRIAVEYGLRLVAVVVDRAVFVNFIVIAF